MREAAASCELAGRHAVGGGFQIDRRVERLAYTRKQAAEALGISLATLDRRVVPAIKSVRTEWGSRLIPVAELERYLAERKQEVRRAHRPPAGPGRRPGLPPKSSAAESAERR